MKIASVASLVLLTGCVAGPPSDTTAAAVAAAEAEAQQTRDNGVEPGNPAPVPFPGSGLPGEKPQTFRCEGTIYRGYKSGCIDFQTMPDGVKWEKKLSAWETRFFTRQNVIGLNPKDKERLCKLAFNGSVVVSCTSVTLGCALGEVVTVGGVTLPCVALGAFICSMSGLAANMAECQEWAHKK